ncbi:MAG: response regulator [bacterium]
MEETKKILIIEDNPDIQEMLRDFLRIYGFESEGVFAGYEALNIIKEKKYDLYIIDYDLSDINGFEVYKKLRIVDGSAPVIFYTAFTGLVSTRTNGIDDPNRYIFPKTSSPEELIRKIETLLGKNSSG